MSIFNLSVFSPAARENPKQALYLPSPEKVSHLIFAYLLVLLAFMSLLTGCTDNLPNTQAQSSDKETAYETLTLNYQGTPSAVTYPELAEDLGYLAPIKLNYIGATISGPQDIQSVVTGDVDFGTAFNGAIIKLKATRIPIKAVIGSYGSDDKTPGSVYVLEDSPIRQPKDLIGKKIAVNALGAHAEFLIKEYLLRNGLTKEEVKNVELITIPPVNMEQVLRAKQVDAAVFIGIGGNTIKELATAKGGLRLLFTDVALFGNFTAGSYVFKENFIIKHPHTVEKLVAATAKAIEWARSTPREQVIARFKQIIAKRGRNENDEAVPYWKSTGIAATGGVILKSEFQPWIDMLVRDGQLKAGEVVAEDIYDNQFNPYFKPTPTKQP